MKLPIITQPHGEHTLKRTEPANRNSIGNQLFTLKDSRGRKLGFTGAELTSLATQWLAFAKFAEQSPMTDGRTIWNSDGIDGPCLICPP